MRESSYVACTRGLRWNEPLEAFEQAEPGTEYVVDRYRDASCNLRTRLGRIIQRAGLKQWSKLWHNLRATRQTELCERYPLHVVCAWLGNSGIIAQEHYLQVTDAHFEAATRDPKPKAAQNQAQSQAEQTEMVGSAVGGDAEFPSDSAPVNTCPNDKYPQGESNPCPLAENQIS